MTWSKWGGARRIDADTYLSRVEQEQAHEVTMRAERVAASAAACDNERWAAENGESVEWARGMWWCDCPKCAEVEW